MAEKTEKKSGGGQIIKLALVLFAVSAIMALALGLVNELTKDTIAMRAPRRPRKHMPTSSRLTNTPSRPILRTTAPSPSSAPPPPAASRLAMSPRPRSPARRA